MAHNSEHPNEEAPHSTSYGQLLLVWFGLLALTGLTVALAGINLGRWIIITALTIASIKTILVVNVFMHLRHEDRVFRYFVAVALLTFVIFIVLTFFDYAFH
jgi:cytochrome c oxidase subunit 4